MRWLALPVVLVAGCNGSHASTVDGGDAARAGAAFVQQRGCPTCHQAPGSAVLAGATDPVAGTMAYPANLTPDRMTGIGTWADIQVVRAIRYGLAADGTELCPTMPRFDTMGDVEADDIVAYLRSLPAVVNPIPPSMCPPIKPPPAPDMAMAPPDGGTDDMQ